MYFPFNSEHSRLKELIKFHWRRKEGANVRAQLFQQDLGDQSKYLGKIEKHLWAANHSTDECDFEWDSVEFN